MFGEVSIFYHIKRIIVFTENLAVKRKLYAAFFMYLKPLPRYTLKKGGDLYMAPNDMNSNSFRGRYI